MIKIKVWYKDLETNEDGCSRVLRNLKPRMYMTSWPFSKLLNYIKEQLFWEDIEIRLVNEISIFNEKEHWICSIRKGS